MELKIIAVIFSRIFRMHAYAFLKKQAKKMPKMLIKGIVNRGYKTNLRLKAEIQANQIKACTDGSTAVG